MNGQKLYDIESTNIRSMEEYIDKHMEAIRHKALSRYEKILSQWEETVMDTKAWLECKCAEFDTYAKLSIGQCRGDRNRMYEDLRSNRRHAAERCSTFVSHNCGQRCRLDEKPVSREQWTSVSPLSVPLLLGWKRIEIQQSGSDIAGPISVFYVAPCNRRLRDMDEVEAYLLSVGIGCSPFPLQISQFSFDPLVSVNSLMYDCKEAGAKVFIPDISLGVESRPVMCVNEVDNEEPLPFEYISKPSLDRVTCKDERFLVCCSCTDNCANRSQCECWQLTIEESKALGQELKYTVGYAHRRLRREQYSGIYECNKECPCNVFCTNRVIQQGLQYRMQVFKTRDRGWGLRSLDDIAKGSFVCTYIGHVYSEEIGNELATRDGDEYQAELDYIEVMEHRKEGYESDVPCSSNEASDSSSESASLYSVQSAGSTRVHLRRSSHGSTYLDPLSSDEDELSVSAIASNSSSGGGATASNSSSGGGAYSYAALNSNSFPDSELRLYDKSMDNLAPLSGRGTSFHPSQLGRTRYYFHEDHTYVMDAKRKGNLGRYINHSCSPNLFVQNVFVDTHDLRFPWVAFFARKRIKAMQELTWDYNYTVGSVEGKRIDCRCGSANCRKRLL